MATATEIRKDLRTPIVCVMGHVDHGKTSLLDRIRGTAVVDKEAGAITQHIGATEVPLQTIQTLCKGMIGGNIVVPGLLFIDTPGHHAFTNLRSRGGALADLAVLVVDINEGFQPQTVEAIKILKQFKTPFVIAANKIDRIHGWTAKNNSPFLQTFNSQPDHVKGIIETKTYELVGRMSDLGFSSDRYDRIRDFTRNIGIIPISARTGEGIPDLLMILIGLAQRFLEESLKFQVTGPGVGTILEVKEERGLGYTIDTIIYDGEIRVGDTIVIGGREKPYSTKVRALLKPKPNREIRVEERFDRVNKVTAASGVKILAPELEKAMAGSQVRVTKESNVEDIIKEIEQEMEQAKIVTDEVGVMVKADTLGSLEAIVNELREAKIPIGRADVGDISKRDIINAETVNDPMYRVMLGFNVTILPDANDYLQTTDIKIFNSDVIYHLIDDFRKWETEQRALAEKKKFAEIVRPGKVKYLPNCTFRQSKPAVIGLQIMGGMLKPGVTLIKPDGSKIGVVRQIQERNENISIATVGKEVAVSIDGPTAGRQINEGEIYFVDVPEGHSKVLEFQLKDTIKQDELETLMEFLAIKRKDNPFWGR
ncbi:translation initiation factor IF-2 [Methanocella arvoryzae]|uniref:Probable translation initiation factor IF-2 n=1 Tax=Methanocella arvoryzae (strain DSM 22066 / NBRC 105507 / MRE50) TaxID=351160 RepID=IF2P_METAR|nr:translation initiation factor IF-2 [Methanocella arvoryzae]Q0W8X2.1 RecName: Full=Probable translation initiation factor IF-2 [Methanocella arvoryzae MRE50]CAJ35154.1 translation initiation factor 2 [Methanocella arvoryzae MRE50]